MNEENSETMEYPTRAKGAGLGRGVVRKAVRSNVNLVVESVEDTAYGTEIRHEAAQVDRAGKYEPKLTENGIPSDVLAKLLPGDDVVELSEPVVGGTVAYRFVKRAFDVVFSAAVLVVFCWLFAIIAILIKVDDPKGPVFFSQERVGKDGRTFRMLKFRSMCVDAEDRLAELRELNEKTGPVFKIAEDPRITRVGKWLRKLSLDELPQFINVLRSDMSIVGPRPALPAEVATYDDYQRQRLLVKPGMTCYWQTRRNRDSITFDEWVELDLLYIKKCSVWSDLKLIIQTVGVVLTAQGS